MGLYAYEQCAHPQAVLFGGWGVELFGGSIPHSDPDRGDWGLVGWNSLGGLYHTLIQIEDLVFDLGR